MELKVGDAATYRRMLFATSYFLSGIPHYWDIVAKFTNQVIPTSFKVHGNSRIRKTDNGQYTSIKQ